MDLGNDEPKDTYKRLLQINTSGNTALPNSGVVVVLDGEGNESALSIGRDDVKVNGNSLAPSIIRQFWSDADKRAGHPFIPDYEGRVYFRVNSTQWEDDSVGTNFLFTLASADAAGAGSPAGWWFFVDGFPVLFYSPDESLELYEAVPATSGWPDLVGPLTFTNTDVAPGQSVEIVGEGSRIEKYIGDIFGGEKSNTQNWVVERLTAALTIENNSSFNWIINGITCLQSQITFVGWVQPNSIRVRNESLVDGVAIKFQSYDTFGIRTEVGMGESWLINYPGGAEGTFSIPFVPTLNTIPEPLGLTTERCGVFIRLIDPS